MGEPRWRGCSHCRDSLDPGTEFHSASHPVVKKSEYSNSQVGRFHTFGPGDLGRTNCDPGRDSTCMHCTSCQDISAGGPSWTVDRPDPPPGTYPTVGPAATALYQPRTCSDRTCAPPPPAYLTPRSVPFADVSFFLDALVLLCRDS
ncbi:hypothetical protein H6P81_018267 [Aristolochia fimbriata]|uniref:Uncharacterized protein n=1 Tax=Aristolochia fimbriata TaxID=158543 RepID=A0AAV7E4V6_ARIFI|nr:hypothetical protein H6P81_018267 [Aristolochia fimbriata]